jgi:integrase
MCASIFAVPISVTHREEAVYVHPEVQHAAADARIRSSTISLGRTVSGRTFAARRHAMHPTNKSAPLPLTRLVIPWNKGRFVGPKPPLKPNQVWAIRLFLQREQRVRDFAMFDPAVYSKLRGCDLVKLKIREVVVNAAARQRATVVQQKTGKPVQFELTEQTRDSLIAWLEVRGGSLDEFVFPSRVDCEGHVSTRQYARLVAVWVGAAGLSPSATAPTACGGPRWR